MDMDSDLRELFKFLGAQIPEMVALFLGMILSLAKWKQHPRPAFFAFLGFGTLLVVSIAAMVGVIYLPRVLPISHETLVVCVWALRSLLYATGIGLLLCAIYVARVPRRPPPPLRPAVEDTVKKLQATVDEIVDQLREPQT